MLGYKRILPINVFIIFCVLLFTMTFTVVWATLCREAIPDHPETGFFYHMVVCMLLSWSLSVWTRKHLQRNRDRYHEQYELEVNNFFYHFTPMIFAKLKRYESHKQLNEMLLLASGLAKEVLVEMEKRHAAR